MLNVYEQIDRNKQKSFFVILGFVAFITLAGFFFVRAFGDNNFAPVGLAFIFSGLSSLGGYFWGDKLILTLSRARPADRKKDFLFFTVTENLSLAAQLPFPKLYVIEDSAPNAFATGRDPKNATICATTGLLEKLNRTELEGVIAHELSHVKNYDTLLMSLVTVLVGVITLLGDWLLRAGSGRKNSREKGSELFALIGFVLALLAPFIAQIIQLAISRSREYLADASAVMITRFPDGLASALAKISQDKEPLEAANKATAHLYISNPLKNPHGGIGWFAGLFNTHPPIQERIARLKQM